MPDSDRLMDLLVEWEEQRQQGKTPTPEQLCPEDPELREALRIRIQKRQRVQALLELSTVAEAKSSAPAPLPAVDGFDILEVLGHGGMGVVYKARQAQLNRLVAVKMILAGAGATARELDRFRAEAAAVAQLQHPNIVQIYEVGDQAGRPYLALEYVDGGSLAQTLAGKPVPARRAAELVLTLARAVQHAHERGIVHRDLKPANVLLTPEGTPKITDFGLAKRLDADRGHTQTGTVLGSPSYMAPEQAEGRAHTVGPAADVYALGAILYELLTGRPPFVGATLLETLEQVRNHDVVPPGHLLPKLPRDLETICLKCLEKQPGQRYLSAEALAVDLQHYLEGEPISARSITFLETVARSVRHSGVDPRFLTWSTLLLWLAPLPFLMQLAVFGGFRHDPRYAFFTLGVAIPTGCFVILTILWAQRTTLRLLPSSMRRQIWSLQLARFVGFLLVPVLVVRMVPLHRPEELFLIFPLWTILEACTSLAIANHLGIAYVVCTVLCVVALLMPLAPAWIPLVASLLMSSTLTFQGLYLRRLGKGAAQEPEAESRAGVSAS